MKNSIYEAFVTKYDLPVFTRGNYQSHLILRFLKVLKG